MHILIERIKVLSESFKKRLSIINMRISISSGNNSSRIAIRIGRNDHRSDLITNSANEEIISASRDKSRRRIGARMDELFRPRRCNDSRSTAICQYSTTATNRIQRLDEVQPRLEIRHGEVLREVLMLTMVRHYNVFMLLSSETVYLVE